MTAAEDAIRTTHQVWPQAKEKKRKRRKKGRRVGAPITGFVIDEVAHWVDRADPVPDEDLDAAQLVAELGRLRTELANAQDPHGFSIQERCGCGPQGDRVVFHRRGSDECRAAK